MLKGRLGLETARVPQSDRHGLLWLSHGNLFAEDGTLQFTTAGSQDLPKGSYAVPYQMLSCILLEPGTTVTHDALRLLASHGTGLMAVGTGAIRMYASMPFGPDASARARMHARLWADGTGSRVHIARRMYAWRLGEVFPNAEIAVLRGIEGARMKEIYRELSSSFGITWRGRRYDRAAPDTADLANQAINHAAVAVRAAAQVAVAVTGTIPQLGFIHEDSGISFALDVADMFRDRVTLPAAFSAVRQCTPNDNLERLVRQATSALLRKEKVVASMIDRIKELFDGDDGGGDAERP